MARGRRRLAQRLPQDVPQEWVEVVCSAFPQISEAQARLDLARTWDVRQTCENVLAQGGQLPPLVILFPPLPLYYSVCIATHC